LGGTMRAVDECRAGEGRCIMGPGRGPAGGRSPPAASWACLDVHEHKGAGRLAAHPATAEAPSRPWDRARSGRAAPGSMTCRNLSTGNACRQRSLCRTCPRAPARLGKGSGQGTRAGRMWTPAPVRCSALCLYNMMTFSPPPPWLSACRACRGLQGRASSLLGLGRGPPSCHVRSLTRGWTLGSVRAELAGAEVTSLCICPAQSWRFALLKSGAATVDRRPGYRLTQRCVTLQSACPCVTCAP